MVLKFIRHITITSIVAILMALLLFQYSGEHAVIFQWSLFITGLTIGLSAFFTLELSMFQKQIVLIPGVFLFYYLLHYLLYVEHFTSPPSSITEKSSFYRGVEYLKNLGYSDLIDFWPIFKSRFQLKHLLALLIGLEGLFYALQKFSFLNSEPIDEENNSSRQGSKTTLISNKRRVKGKRFKRRF